jgi:hypothetical protein
MATAFELDKIRSNPIKEGVGTFRRLFESTRSDLGIALSSDTVQIVFSTAAAAGMAQLLGITFLTNVRSCQKSCARPYPSFAKPTSKPYPSFTNR